VWAIIRSIVEGPSRSRVGVATLLAVALVSAACDGTPSSTSEPSRLSAAPDIFLISIDTLRADHVSAYGHERKTTPFIDGLAEQGVLFTRAYSTTSWTVPALVSMLTSSYPSRHGVGQGVHGPRGRWEVIPEELPTLSELFREHGYRTYGLTANFGLPADRGFARGFDRYECVGAVDLEQVRLAVAPWLAELHEGRPWLFWLHLFDPHAPYLARERWLSSLEPLPRERFEELDGLAANRLSTIAGDLDDERLNYLRALYDSEIRAVDEYLREVFDSVPRARDALVVFVADHGEEFLEHGGVLHGKTLFEEAIRVPLIVRFPDGRLAGTVHEGPVSIVDILPTIAESAGIPLPPGLAGASLFGPHGLRDPGGSRPVVAELVRGAGIRAWIGKRWKYVAEAGNPAIGSLYDLERDPGEIHDLAGQEAERAGRLGRELADFARRNTRSASPEQTEMTPEQAEALRTLGYIR
jgi:arylsulfatase A-like enzyme